MTKASHKDPMGDRLKAFEFIEAGRRLIPGLPTLARLDGRCFSGLTRSLNKPYEEKFCNVMIATTRALVEEFRAIVGYTQSDEITLLWSEAPGPPFDGKTHKITSCLAAFASVVFDQNWCKTYPTKQSEIPTFDCRIWAVPNRTEATNCVLWREFDATKNSISAAAQQFYSHQELLGKSSKDKQELLFQRGINWNLYPDFFKRGSYLARRRVITTLTEDELKRIPEEYRPTEPVERWKVQLLKLPPLAQVTNRVEVLFNGEEPALGTEKAPGSSINDAAEIAGFGCY